MRPAIPDIVLNCQDWCKRSDLATRSETKDIDESESNSALALIERPFGDGTIS